MATVDGQVGVPSTLIRYGGYLTSRTHADAETIARDYLVRHETLFRLSRDEVAGMIVTNRYVTKHNGVTQLTLQQMDGGRPVYGAFVTFAIDRLGRILIVGGRYFPGVNAVGGVDVSAADAVGATAESIGLHAGRLQTLLIRPNGTTFANTLASSDVYAPNPISAQLVTFPMPGGLPARLAWKTVVLANNAGWYESVIDAQTGQLLSRRNYFQNDAEGNVYTVQHPAISGATQQITSFAGAAFDNAGWVSGRKTSGNNVNAYQDLDGSDAVGYQPETPDTPDPGYQHFDFTFTNAWGTGGTQGVLAGITADRDPVVTQMFYYENRYHDALYELGFNEASGNFQQDNFGRGGSGGDPVLAEADDSWATQGCNANFATPSDGSSPRMQMYVGKPSCGNNFIHRAMNGDTIFHESSHGLSNRLVGGGNLDNGVQTGAMGEGWGDFMATSYWNDPVYGDYNNGDTTKGIRHFSYANSPLKYSNLCNVGGGCEVHDDGEIWGATLWDMRTALVNAYGLGAGNTKAEQLVVDGMKNTPTKPTFLQGRDGILAADTADYGGANQCRIWGAFAGREMGFSASTSGTNDMSPTTATNGPASCTPVANIGGPYTTNEGTNAALNAGGTTENGDGPFTYSWDLNDDGVYGDATGKTPSFTSVGQDGVYPIKVKVTNADGFSSTAATTVTVNNVVPTVTTLTNDGPKAENSAVTATVVVTDPGWLDAPTATIDWGDGSGPAALVGTLVNGLPPSATLSASPSHTYGDNGTFTLTICPFDEAAGPCSTSLITVNNVNPTAVIDKSGATTVNGVATFIGHAGTPMPFSGSSTDPGSDDLTLTWNWGDGSPNGVLVSLNDPGLGPDPFPSSTINPRSVSDARSHTFGDACYYTVTFTSLDDDGGSNADNVAVIIAGNSGVPRNAGYWQTQYRPRPTAFTEARRLCYLQIADFMSAVFHEQTDAQTVANAFDVLFVGGNGGSAKQQLDRQLLTAWLNFANGGFEYGQLVDVNGDGIPDTAFSTVLANAEAVRLNAASTDDQLRAQKAILERINGS